MAGLEVDADHHVVAELIVGAALDAVTDPAFAGKIGRLGGLAVLNLEGIHTRYEDTGPLFNTIAHCSKTEVTEVLQKFYTQPIQLELIAFTVDQLEAPLPCTSPLSIAR